MAENHLAMCHIKIQVCVVAQASPAATGATAATLNPVRAEEHSLSSFIMQIQST